MQPIKIERIVAGVDFSNWTESVLRTAAEMASRYSAKLTAVHAERFSTPIYFTEQRLSKELNVRRDEARAYLNEVVQKTVGDAVDVNTQLIEKPPSEAILQTVKDVDAGLIVLGRYGHSGLNRLLMGSVTENIFRRTNVPMLTVPRGSKELGWELGKILCPVNYTKVARKTLRYAVDVADRFSAELKVVRILEEEYASKQTVRQEEQRLSDWIPDEVQTRCTLDPVVRQGDPTEEILTEARAGDYDLIVIGAQHKPMLEATIFGTTSIRVMRHAKRPVLTIIRN